MTTKKTYSDSTAISGAAGPTIIDLDALAYADQAEVKITHPHDAAKAVLFSVILAGPGHPQTLAQEEEERRADLEEMEKYQREAREALDAGLPTPRHPEQRRTVAELRVRNAARVAARIISSSGQVKFGGEVINLTPVTATAVLADPNVPFIYEQIFTFLRNRENFTPTSAKAS